MRSETKTTLQGLQNLTLLGTNGMNLKTAKTTFDTADFDLNSAKTSFKTADFEVDAAKLDLVGAADVTIASTGGNTKIAGVLIYLN